MYLVNDACMSRLPFESESSCNINVFFILMYSKQLSICTVIKAYGSTGSIGPPMLQHNSNRKNLTVP